MKQFYYTYILQIKIIIFFAVLILAGFALADTASAAYYTSGNWVSTNLLAGETVSSIDSFVYNLSAKPANTNATIQFSQNGASWYNSSGALGGTDTLTTGVNNTIDLSGLGWSGANFYYKVTFTSDGTGTSVLDDVSVYFTSNHPPTIANVEGWAWSENIGWVSFNSTSGGGSINYGVNIKADGTFEGQAWSENIGWISFNRSETGAPPAAPYNGTESYIAKIDTSTGEVSGWARALAASSAESGGWDGWIKMRGSYGAGTYGVFLNSSTKEFESWAWGGDDSNGEAVIGWLSFNCKDRGVCGTSDYKVITSFNVIPVPVISDFRADFSNPCVQSRIPTFSWKIDGTETPTMSYDYEIRLCKNSNCSDTNDPLVSASATSTYGTSWVPPSDKCSHCCNTDPYNQVAFGGGTYYAQVRARNPGGEWSGWATANFQTKDHCYPIIEFSWSPDKLYTGETVQFTDESSVDESAGATTSSWYWTFQYGDPATSTDQNPTTTFSQIVKETGNEVTLEVCDSKTGVESYCCSDKDYVPANLPLPEYKEVAPII